MTSALATGPAPQRRRLSGDERRRAIVDGAAERFAEAGFATSTRALAEGMGVTQALLYRYFDSKEALIEAVFQTWFLERDQRGDPRVLQDRSHPLAERLAICSGPAKAADRVPVMIITSAATAIVRGIVHP